MDNQQIDTEMQQQQQENLENKDLDFYEPKHDLNQQMLTDSQQKQQVGAVHASSSIASAVVLEQQLKVMENKMQEASYAYQRSQREFETQRSLNVALQKSIHDKDQSLAELQHKVQLMEKNMHRTDESAAQAQSDFQKENQTLKNALKAKDQQIEDLNLSLNTIKQQFQELQSSSAEKQTHQLSLQTDLQLFKSQSDRLQLQAKTDLETINSLQQELNSTKLLNLQHSSNAENKQIILTQHQIQHESELQHKQQVIASHQNEIYDLQQQLVKTQKQSQLDAEQRIDLESQISRLQIDLRQKESVQQQHTLQQQSFQSLQDSKDQQISVFKTHMLNKDQEIQSLREKVTSLAANMPESLNSQVRFADFPGKLQHVVTQNKDLKSQIAASESKLADLEQSKNYFKQELEKLRLRSQCQEKQLQYERTAQENKTKAIANLHNELTVFKQALQQQEKPVQDLVKKTFDQFFKPHNTQNANSLDFSKELERLTQITVEERSKREQSEKEKEDIKSKYEKQNTQLKLVYEKLKEPVRIQPQQVQSSAQDMSMIQNQHAKILEEKLLEIVTLKHQLHKSQTESKQASVLDQPMMPQQNNQQVERFTSQISSMKEQISTYLTQINELSVKESASSQALLKAQNSEKLLQLELKTNQDVIQNLKSTVTQQSSSLHELQTKMTQLEQQNLASLPLSQYEQLQSEATQLRVLNSNLNEQQRGQNIEQLKTYTAIENLNLQCNNLQRLNTSLNFEKSQLEHALKNTSTSGNSIPSNQGQASSQLHQHHQTDQPELKQSVDLHLIQQIERQYTEQLEDREQLISQLQNLIAELEKASKEQNRETEVKVQTLLDQHKEALEQSTQNTVELKAENLSLQNKIVQLDEEVKELKDREETLQYTSGIQADEITRLATLPAEQQELQSSKKMQALSIRLDSIQQASHEKDQQILHLRQQIEHSQSDQSQKTALLHQENTNLTQTNALLQKELDVMRASQQQKSLLKHLSTDQLASTADEQMLIQQERTSRAEQMQEQLRVDLFTKIEEGKKTRDQLLKAQFELSKNQSDWQADRERLDQIQKQLTDQTSNLTKNVHLEKLVAGLKLKLTQVEKDQLQGESYKKQITDQTAKIQKMESEIEQRKNLHVKNVQMFKEKVETCQKLQNENQEHQKQVSELKEQVKKLESATTVVTGANEIAGSLNQENNTSQPTASRKFSLQIEKEMHEAIELLKAEKENNSASVSGPGQSGNARGEDQTGSNVQKVTSKLLNTLLKAKNVVEKLSDHIDQSNQRLRANSNIAPNNPVEGGPGASVVPAATGANSLTASAQQAAANDSTVVPEVGMKRRRQE